MKKNVKNALIEGNIFLVPLEDNNFFGVGEILKITPDALNSVVCIFYSYKYADVDEFDMDMLSQKDVISTQFITPDLIKNGTWPIVACRKTELNPEVFLNFSELFNNRFLNVNIEGSAIIRKFLSAYHGLHPWNCYYREDYFDDLLATNVVRPSNIYLS